MSKNKIILSIVIICIFILGFFVGRIDYDKLPKAELSEGLRGEYGIDNLNKLLQDTFNPKDPDKIEKSVGSLIFRENDKILQLKNRPSDDVYNGDIGILEEIDLTQKCFLINYQNTYVLYNYDELDEISLAYALSVHKSQGSEYQVVYFIMNRSNMYMLNKKLIYTAISRAKTKLTIIAEESVFKEGIRHMLKTRNTSLKQRLMEN